MVDIYIHNSIKSCKYGKKSGQHGTSSSFETYTHAHIHTNWHTQSVLLNEILEDFKKEKILWEKKNPL